MPFLLVVILLFTSCVSNKRQDLLPVPATAVLAQTIQRVQRACTKIHQPGFLAEVMTTSADYPSFQVEGVWKNKFNTLHSRVVSPTGEDYVRLSLQKHRADIESADKNILSDPAIANLLSTLGKLDAQGVRSILCGGYALQQHQEKDGLFYNSTTEKNIIFSTLNVDGHALAVESIATLQSDVSGATLVFQSSFSYGPFGKKLDIDLEWHASVASQSIQPQTIFLRTANTTYSVDILDYQ